MTPRAIPEILEHLRGIRHAILMTSDPEVMTSLHRRREELRAELAEAERRLRDGE